MSNFRGIMYKAIFILGILSAMLTSCRAAGSQKIDQPEYLCVRKFFSGRVIFADEGEPEIIPAGLDSVKITVNSLNSPPLSSLIDTIVPIADMEFSSCMDGYGHYDSYFHFPDSSRLFFNCEDYTKGFYKNSYLIFFSEAGDSILSSQISEIRNSIEDR